MNLKEVVGFSDDSLRCFPLQDLRGLALRGREAHSTIVWPHPTLLCVVTQDAERFSLDVSKQERKLYLKAT